MLRASIIVFLLLAALICRGQQNPQTEKRINLAAIPLINYNTTIGLNMGVMSQAFYRLNSRDTISPVSSTGVLGMYTTNGTYFLAAFQRFYIDEDKWRVLMAAGIGNVNFQFWQETPYSEGIFVGYDSRALFGMLRFERKLYKGLFFGLNGVYSSVETGYDLPEWVPDSLKSEELNMHHIGYLFNLDKREHQINPYGGYNIVFMHSFYGDLLNSTYSFQSFQLTYNHFYQLGNQRNIIATRFKADISSGDVPFQGQNVVGGDDIRGYSSGKYRNNQLYAVQAEYRWRFYKRFGMVGFLGMATVTENLASIGDSELLPGAGAGFRYLMLPEQRINIGIDVALGKDDWGLYFRIGESFGR